MLLVSGKNISQTCLARNPDKPTQNKLKTKQKQTKPWKKVWGRLSDPSFWSPVRPGYGSPVRPWKKVWGRLLDPGFGSPVRPGYGSPVRSWKKVWGRLLDPGFGSPVRPGYGSHVRPGYGSPVRPYSCQLSIAYCEVSI